MTTPRWMAAALMLAAACQGALAQSWPTKQIEMIIAFPAGSGVDVIGRAMASAITQQLGHTVVVDGGPVCPRCGNSGCLDVVAGSDALVEQAEPMAFFSAPRTDRRSFRAVAMGHSSWAMGLPSG